jgi:protein gp37
VAVHPDALDIPHRWKQPRVVFVNSMSDLFHAQVPTPFIKQVFEVMAETPRHTYQLLTKRPKRLARLADELPWPSNVWMGVTVENAVTRWRADELRKVPAACPLHQRRAAARAAAGPRPRGDRLADRGRGERPAASGRLRDRGWPTSAISAPQPGTAYFFKQWGGARPKSNGRQLDGRTWSEMPSPRVPIQV